MQLVPSVSQQERMHERMQSAGDALPPIETEASVIPTYYIHGLEIYGSFSENRAVAVF